MSDNNYHEFFKKLIELKVVYYSKGRDVFVRKIDEYQNTFHKNSWGYKLLNAIKHHHEGADVDEIMFDDLMCCISCNELIRNYFKSFNEEDRNKYRLKERRNKGHIPLKELCPHRQITWGCTDN